MTYSAASQGHHPYDHLRQGSDQRRRKTIPRHPQEAGRSSSRRTHSVDDAKNGHGSSINGTGARHRFATCTAPPGGFRSSAKYTQLSPWKRSFRTAGRWVEFEYDYRRTTSLSTFLDIDRTSASSLGSTSFSAHWGMKSMKKFLRTFYR